MIKDEINENNYIWNNILKVFFWKKPLFYISILAAIGFYYYIFVINFREENFGLMEISKSIRFLTIAFFTFWIGLPFIVSKPIRKIKSKYLRFFILFCFVFLASLVVSFLSWEYYIYDSKQLNSYKRLFPLKNSLSYRNRETLIFQNIKEAKIFGSGEDSRHGFIMNNNKRYYLSLTNFTMRSKNIFLANLYYEYEWLRDSIEETYGTIERIESNIEYFSIYRFNIYHFLFFGVIIWMLILFFIILILYAYNPYLKI
ncbi:MAG: hypothetical protein LBU88_07175 [Treponema sp.]|jgi:ABC-type multidrug transport system fused ATPase/permease subunit|nr:hypothetical protein [Treponema sp.]